MTQWFDRIIIRLMQYERCIHTLSLSFCMGIYIAFCPFVGLHTALVFLCAWLFALNFAVMLSVSMLVNNPWTMIPVYGAGHMFGDWVLSWWGIDHYEWNPSWISSMNAWARQTVGMGGFSFWAFMLGGNVLGVALGVMCYPMIKRFFLRVKERGKKNMRHTMARSKRVARKLVLKAQPLLIRVKAASTKKTI